jgi:ornithine cyclodeaminase/alanine dehydrogenase-like protein (mu-crystallin family)
MTILITEQETRELLSIEAAIPVLEDAFRMAGERSTDNSDRIELPAGDGYLLFRAAAMRAKKLIGFKILSSFGSGPRLMWNYLYSTETGELLAIVQSRAISGLRTAATSAVAVKHLSPATASLVGMYGSGRQAETQLEAICCVRPIKKACVYSRDPQKLQAFCERMSGRLGIEVAAAASPELVPQDADLIVTMTNAETPVLLGEWIKRPSLVVAAGANEWYQREIDETAIARAALIVVDDEADAKRHSGDLLWAASKGAFRWSEVVSLGDIVAGRVPLPDLGAGLILFESHGIALEDVAITAAAYERARERGLGSEVRL